MVQDLAHISEKVIKCFYVKKMGMVLSRLKSFPKYECFRKYQVSTDESQKMWMKRQSQSVKELLDKVGLFG